MQEPMKFYCPFLNLSVSITKKERDTSEDEIVESKKWRSSSMDGEQLIHVFQKKLYSCFPSHSSLVGEMISKQFFNKRDNSSQIPLKKLFNYPLHCSL